jgi:hypothetical protein
MKLNEFVEKYKGKAVDFDKMYGAQCVDLVRQYFQDVWELPKQPEGVTGAQDFYYQHESRQIQKQLCECHAYTGANLPPAGSVVIFKSTATNKFGHIAICLKAAASGLEVLEQDGIANEKALKEGRAQKGAYVANWNYERLVGWLTKKE